MTRVSKRKSDDQSSASAKIARADSVRSASNKAATKVNQRIDGLYDKYANTSSGMIDPDGVEALCSDLEVDHTDVRILMLAWKMNAEKQGYFTQDEWRRGLKALRVDNINKLKKALPELEREVLKSGTFEDFYKYAFIYCLTEEKQKCLDIESACVLIDLVLGSQYQSQVDSFVRFLKIQSDYKVMNKDQWTNFLRFCQEISFPDLENYDTCEAWPLLIDNFVDWLKQKEIPDGVEALCSDLEVDHTDVRILMLAWKMNAEKQGYFTQDEWRRGLKALRVDNINKLKKALPELEREVLKSGTFEDFYKYAFIYCLTEEKQKCLDIESACVLIDLVLGSQYQSQVDSFVRFLKIQSDYKVMNKDQWTNFLRFCQEISFPDLENYDTCEAWPLLIDNFVDWLKQKEM